VEEVVGKAKLLEKKYEWLEAAQLYEQAYRAVGKSDFLRKGEIQERVGHCFHRGAFQAETQEESKRRMGLSMEAYEEAAGLFERLEGSEKQTIINCCMGKALYSKSWLAEDSSKRKALLDECWKLQKEALKVYEETGDRLGYGKTCNELLTCLEDRRKLAWDWQELKRISEEAIEFGEKAIDALSEVRDEYELARAYCMLSLHSFEVGFYESIEKQREIRRKGLTYAQKALEISEKVEDLYLIGMSSLAIGNIIMEEKGDIESSLRHREKALELGTKINDKLMIGWASDMLAYTVWWKAEMEEDPDKRREGFNKAIQFTKDAIVNYQLVSYPPVTGVEQGEYYWYLAFDETNLAEKRVLLEKAVEVGRGHVDQAERSGSPGSVISVFHSLSKALFSLSTLETSIGEKRKSLEEALKYREETIKLTERSYPFDYWNRGVTYNHSAWIKAEQAKNVTDNQGKIGLVKKAVQDMEACLKFCRTGVRGRVQLRLIDSIGYFQYYFGGILNQLYLLTGEHRHLERAISVYEETVQAWKKTDRHSRVAEAHWQMAKLYDHLSKHSKAADEFESASERYTLAAEKMPQLKAFYIDYAMYMQAWGEIEKAKHHHAEKQYGQAKEHYEKAASLHKKTERWSYLSPNYSALARMEEAEDQSRREQTEESRDLFQQAAKLFLEAKESIEAKLEKIEAEDENEMATELGKASDIRCEYCLGRINLEEAKILDRQGNHAASSAKYASAAEKFQKAFEAMENESDRQEMKPIFYLCRAWQMMTRAEAEVSPDLYLEASNLFEKAKEHTLDEKAKVLALGHSRFCKALEAGTRFEDTGDIALYSTAKKHLEAAEKHYLKVGFKNASEYSKATHMLFDAYMYLNKAEMETEPEKKTQYFRMAERLLQASAGAYMKARHPEKNEEVKRLLEGIKEKRQIAMSLTEMLHAPTITSTTTSFSTPTATHEQAVGLERFEHADILANLILRAKEVRVGEDVNLRLELVNAGKAPALLIKVDEIIPEGFEVKEVPEVYVVEDSFINLKGKRLNPLKTEDVKMVIKPRSKGTFRIKPRILYIDENGKYKSHEPEPVTITVKELGIKGWIKGER